MVSIGKDFYKQLNAVGVKYAVNCDLITIGK